MEISVINKKIHDIEESLSCEVCVDFSQRSLSSLINASNGSLSWKGHALYYKDDFFEKDEQSDDLPSDIQVKYLK